MPDITSLSVRVTADTSEAESGLARLNSQVGSTGSAIATAFGVAAVAGIAAAGGALVGTIKTAADFEKQMSAVGAVAGASAGEMQQLTSAALQLGKDTSFSAKEAAQGIEELVKAGVSVTDIMGGGARASLDLAAAGAVSVKDAAELASNAMNVFNKSGSEMGHVADVIAGTANASALDVNEFKFALAASGAVAASVGIGFEDLASAFGVMSNAGLKGSDMGTSLKTMMLNLTPSTKAQTAAFRELGLITETGSSKFFDATGKAKSFAEIAGILQEATKNLTEEQRIQALQTMFGTDAIRVAAVMAKEGAAAFTDMATASAKIGARAVGEERLNNLAGSIEKLTGSLETGAIILGSMFTPALKGMVDVLTEQVNTGIDALEQIPDVIETIKQVLAGDWATDASIRPFTNAVGEAAIVFRDQFLPSIMAAADFVTGTLVPAFTAIGTFLADHAELIAGVAAAWAAFAILSTVAGWITGAIAAFGAMSAAITAAGGVIAAIIAVLGGPLTVAILAVAAIVGVLTAAWIGNWGDIQGKTAVVAEWLKTTLTEVGTFLTQLGTESVLLWQMMVTSWDGIVAAVTAAWAAITAAVQAGWDGTVALFTASMAAIQGVWDAGWALIRSVATAAWNLLSAENQAKVTELIALITTLWQLLPALWTAGTAAITTTTTAWWTALAALWTTSTTAVTTTTTSWWTALGAAWTAGTKALTDLVTPWWATIRAVWQAAHDAIVAGVQAFFKLVSDAWTSATATLSGIAASLGTAIMDALLGALNAAAGSVVDSVIGTVRKAIDGAKSLIAGFGPGTPGGGSSDPAEYLTQAALARGIDPEQVKKVMMKEGGAAWESTGNFSTGTSVGPLQLHYAGGSDPTRGMGDDFTRDTGIDLRTDKSPEAGKKAIDYALDRLLKTGDYREYYGADPALGSRFTPVNRVAPSIKQANTPQVSQFQMGLDPGAALAACGPAALSWFMNQAGRTPTGAEATQLAAAAGWDPQRGMYGPAAFGRALSSAGISNVVDTTPTAQEVGALATAGTPFAISTGGTTDELGNSRPGHYFQVQGGNLGALNVGASGTALRGGSAIMSLDQIVAMTGAMNGLITVSGQMGDALTAAGTEGGASFAQITTGAIAAGQALVSTSTDTLGNVTRIYSDATGTIGATVTDAAGRIVNSWGTMTTGVTDQANLMASGALTSVTNLGTGVLTTITDSAGSTISTVTDMQGQVTSQYATLANGATLTMGDMAAGILTSTTDLGTGVMTTVQDMSGNYITTITDMSGNVTAQYTQLASDVTAQTVAQSEAVQAETVTMSEAVLTSVTDMGDGIITITTDSSGQMVATITDMAGNVTSTYDSMSTDVVGSVTDLGETVVEQFGNVASEAQDAIGPIEDFGSALIEIPQADMSDTVKQFGQAAEAAKKAQKAIKALADASEDLPGSFGGSKGGNSGLGKKAGGGWTIPDQTTLVGELGPELISTSRPMYVTPNDRLMAPAMSNSGGGHTDTLVIEFKVDGKTAERIYVTGRELASRRGRDA